MLRSRQYETSQQYERVSYLLNINRNQHDRNPNSLDNFATHPAHVGYDPFCELLFTLALDAWTRKKVLFPFVSGSGYYDLGLNTGHSEITPHRKTAIFNVLHFSVNLGVYSVGYYINCKRKNIIIKIGFWRRP